MNNIAAFLAVVNAYCSAVGIAEATLSTRLFMDGKRLKAIRAGSDVGVIRLDRAFAWLSEHWPEDKEWPPTVARPSFSREAAE